MKLFKTYKFILSTLLVIISVLNSYSQKNLAKGIQLYDLNMFEEAIPYFQKEMDGGAEQDIKLEAMIQLANCYRLLGQFIEAEEMYQKIFKKKKRDPENVLNYAHALKASAKYEEAAEEFKKYKEMNPSDPMGDIYIESCQLAQQWLEESLGDEVRNMTKFNSPEPDFATTFYEKGIVFCSSREGSIKKLISFQGKYEVALHDLYYVPLNVSAEKAQAPISLKGLNTYQHEGPASFSSDNNTVYFTRTIEAGKDRKKGVVLNTLQIFISHRDTSNVWEQAISAVSFNSNEYSVGHPSLSADGKSLYFMSDMPGGFGGTDIYVSYKDANEEWGKPINLGSEVNTFGYELFPFIHADRTLYFSSNTHPGMGKLDIFSAKYINNTWTQVTNLKPPINSIGDDFAFIKDSKYKRGFFSSNRFNGIGYDDIYSFISDEPRKVIVGNKTITVEDLSLFDGVAYKLIDNETKKEVESRYEDGKEIFNLDEDKNYTLVSRKEGFAFNKVDISIQKDIEKGKEILKTSIIPQFKSILIGGELQKTIEKSSSDSTIELSKAPLIGASIQIKKDNIEIGKTSTNSLGEYSFNEKLEVGNNYTIIINTDNKGISKKVSTVKAKGFVQSNEGNPLGKALVLLLKEGDIVEEKLADSKGQYEFDLSPNEEYSIIASNTGYKNSYVNVSTQGKTPGDVIENNVMIEKKQTVIYNGKIGDKGTPIGRALVTVSDGSKIITKTHTDDDGEFSLSLLPDLEYEVTVTKQGYLQKDLSISTKDEDGSKPLDMKVEVDKIGTDNTPKKINIYYDLNSKDLRPASLPALFKIVEFLKQNPEVKIEISAHTDSRGGDELNLKLSQERAESVALFLYFEGDVEKERIIAKGYGETMLINHCSNGVNCSEEEHQENRRTELKIISY